MRVAAGPGATAGFGSGSAGEAGFLVSDGFSPVAVSPAAPSGAVSPAGVLASATLARIVEDAPPASPPRNTIGTRRSSRRV